jgi:hypothetical protein
MGETVRKHLDNANSAWHKLSHVWRSASMHHGLPHGAMSCRHSHSVLLLKKRCLIKHSHTNWRFFLNWKEFAPRESRAITSQARRGRGEQSWD